MGGCAGFCSEKAFTQPMYPTFSCTGFGSGSSCAACRKHMNVSSLHINRRSNNNRGGRDGNKSIPPQKKHFRRQCEVVMTKKKKDLHLDIEQISIEELMHG